MFGEVVRYPLFGIEVQLARRMKRESGCDFAAVAVLAGRRGSAKREVCPMRRIRDVVAIYAVCLRFKEVDIVDRRAVYRTGEDDEDGQDDSTSEENEGDY